MQHVIVLRKIRDFGERVSDTLFFLKLNWKKLFLLYAVFVIPFLLLGSYFGASGFVEFFSKISSLEVNKASNYFTLDFFLAILLFILATTSYATAIYSYMRLYEEMGGAKPSIAQVGKIYISKFLSNVGYAILIILIMFVGIFAAVIPILGILAYLVGLIYFLIALCVLFPSNTSEESGFGSAFGRSFYLIRNRWWFTFGYSMILVIIYYFFAYIIQFIVMIIFGISSVNFIDPEGASSDFSKKLVYVLGLLAILQQIFYLIVHVGLGVHYYSLREEKEGTGLEQRLEHLGERPDPRSTIEEQY
jgi:hypothetical protein